MDQELESLELKISKFLRLGVLVAGAFMLVGWLANVLRGVDAVGRLTIYAKMPLVDDLVQARGTGDWAQMSTYLGLLILILLPFSRVVLTMILFLRRREWILAAAAGFVSLALVVSVVLGIDL